ncbi:class I SAM-dependent methyltransferase [Rubritalea sp.]|uniref:class I SAM-dependent methyltransferase n=1 Tax=Rubritalea sp. TaxID=2109375 RepID=UPI003EFA1E8F
MSNPATLGLHSLLVAEISALGPMPFDKWMQHCLYHSEYGYYNRGADHVGRSGDFFTSVSVGSCFGSILAERIVKYVKQHQECEILEIGANTGQLANDILTHLQTNHTGVYEKISYTICEPLEQMRSVQQDNLSEHILKITHANSLADFSTSKPSGIILSNELIDAFPVKLVMRQGGQWLERYVDYDGSNFQWTNQVISTPRLMEFTQSLADYPDGYQTEYRPSINSFASLCARCFDQALSITIDYGYSNSSFYDPYRNTGTLRCFFQHKADEDPLTHVGLKDITAHVDFTQLAQSFTEAGLSPQYFDSQTRYLISHAPSLLKKIETGETKNPAKWIRQFQTLTHPSIMGQQFNVLECELGLSANKSAMEKLELL